MLATGAGGAERINPDVGFVQFNFVDRLGLGQHGYRARRGVNPTLGFGFGYALHPVSAGFELQPAVYVRAVDAADDFLVAAMLAGPCADNFHVPLQ